MSQPYPALRTDKHIVYSFLCNKKGLIRLSSIAQLFQESAWLHAESCQVGYSQLQKEGMMWILFGLKMEIDALPAWGDSIFVTTLGRKYENLFAYRDYFLYASEKPDRPLVKASSSWLLVDAFTHRPKRITREFMKIPGREGELAAGQPGKIDDSSDLGFLRNIEVVYSDIDIYKHVNNTRYIQWCIDSSDEFIQREDQCKSLNFRFISEAKLGDEIEITHLKDSFNTLKFKGLNKGLSKEVFLSEVQFRESTTVGE